ncbi:outer membrane beta-barrel family protein [Arcicella aquatica]|uniref:Outer membrane beta-barrel family protein n=1 Tax=Arcicella aquatica TaxID=217141 RepID=A0ABU5QVD8_9BACT|nr:outer membrane beta-barrel family protein [Arcicella aquatica]MEA5261003.1 outer membrane beta-barrel family protein [Arcicella aquatica]
MKKLLSLILIIFTTSEIALAQFGGPPNGGGGGDGNGRNRSTQQNTPSFEINTPKGNSKISGFIIDSTATSAVEFANISLISKTTNKPVDGTMADDKGKFLLTKVAVGDYKLQISFIGFESKIINDIKVEKGKDIDLGILKLSPISQMLDGVTVTAEKAMIEEKVDRLVYNAEKDMLAKGGDASDILKKVPMLSVDLDGNVSLRGTTNIKVLINNKPSTIVASSIADALKMIPADLIKTVEVITSPSAKYDAEGSAGIINIITKKSSIEGLTLNLDSGVGLRASNLGLNGSYRHGKLGITLGGFGRLFYNKAGTTLEQSTVKDGVTQLTQQSSDAKDNGLFGRYNLGFDYEISKTQSISSSIAFGTRNLDRNQEYVTKLFSNNNLTSTSYRDVDSKDLSNSVDINVDYIKTFKPQQEWSISTQFSQNNLTNNFDANILNGASELLSRQKNINGNTNREITVQTDYQTPIKQNQMFEVGLKSITRQVDSDYQYLYAGSTGGFSTDARNPSGLLNYKQTISSGYVSYTYSTKNKYTFKVGTRYEYTTIDAVTNVNSINIPSYGNLVPSINISKSLGTATLKLAYNNRIQRPGLQQLNPNFNASNAQNITIGNPSLKPEVTNNVELSLSKNINRTYLNVSLFGRQTNNSIVRISAPSDTLAGAIVTTFQNIGRQQTLGANIFGNTFITPKWSLNGGIDIYYNYLDGQVANATGGFSTISNTGLTIGGRITSQLQLNNGWGVQAFGGYRGNQVQLQGSQNGMGMYSLGVKKDINNKRGSIGLAAENFFGGMTMTSTLNTAQFNQKSVNNIYNQNIKLTFSYKIGNMKFVEQKKSKSVKNDDVKGGESNN